MHQAPTPTAQPDAMAVHEEEVMDMLISDAVSTTTNEFGGASAPGNTDGNAPPPADSILQKYGIDLSKYPEHYHAAIVKAIKQIDATYESVNNHEKKRGKHRPFYVNGEKYNWSTMVSPNQNYVIIQIHHKSDRGWRRILRSQSYFNKPSTDETLVDGAEISPPDQSKEGKEGAEAQSGESASAEVDVQTGSETKNPATEGEAASTTSTQSSSTTDEASTTTEGSVTEDPDSNSVTGGTVKEKEPTTTSTTGTLNTDNSSGSDADATKDPDAQGTSSITEATEDNAGGAEEQYDYDDPLSYISFSKDDSNKHKWNNTGYVFERKDGKPMTSSEAYRFIKAKQKEGDPDFLRDFPRMQKSDIENTGQEPPRFTLENDKNGYKYYNFVFSPDWNKEEEEEPTIDEGNEDWVGPQINQTGYVKLRGTDSDGNYTKFPGIRLHTTPDPNDADYTNRTGDAETIYGPGQKVTIIAEGNEKAPGWSYVQIGDKKGWIETAHLKEGKKDFSDLYHYSYVEKGETVTDKLYEIEIKRDIGYDNKLFAEAFYLLNKDNPGVHLDGAKYKKSLSDNATKNAVDPWDAKKRAIFQSIEVDQDAVVKVPTKKQIDKYIAEGKIEVRPDWFNSVVKGGRIALGLLEGIPKGIYKQAVENVEGIWDMIKSIFSGEILDQLEQLYDQLMKMTLDDLGDLLLALIGIDLDEFERNWNNENVQERYEYVGEVIGRIVFEVLLAVFSGGGGIVAKLGKGSKLLDKCSSLRKITDKVGDSAGGLVDPSTQKKLKKMGDDKGPDAPNNRTDIDNNVDARNANKLEASDGLKKIPDDAKKMELEGKKSGKDFDGEAQKDLDKELDKPENAKQKKYRANKLAALATAKAIEAGADKIDLPIKTVMPMFDFLKAIKGVDDFTHTSHGDGKYTIFMIGTKIKVDNYDIKQDKKTENYKTKQADASNIKKRQPELGGKTPPSGGRGFSKKKGERPDFAVADKSGGVKGHASKHGGEGKIVPTDPDAYYNQAIDNMNGGQKFNYHHGGQNKNAYISKVGDDQFLLTGVSSNNKTIFTHHIVSQGTLEGLGITLK